MLIEEKEGCMDVIVNNASREEVEYKVTTWDDPDGVSGKLEFFSYVQVTVDNRGGGAAKVVFTNSDPDQDAETEGGADYPTTGIASYTITAQGAYANWSDLAK